MRLLEDAKELHAFYSRSGLTVPDALVRLFGEHAQHRRERVTTRMTIPPLPRPEAPPDAGPEWLWVPEKDAAVVSLVLASLRRATGPSTPAHIFDALSRVRDGINKGSVANLGKKLADEGVIQRSDDGWVLAQVERAPLSYHGHLWGPLPVFEKSEVAAYRRHAVKHILRTSPDGLQLMQITKTLAESCPWFNRQIPASKDLLKMDIKEMESERIVRQKGHSGKWELVG